MNGPGKPVSAQDSLAAAVPVVALNTTPLLSPLGGIGQYTGQLARHLLAMGGVDLRYFCGATWSRNLRNAPAPGIDGFKAAIKRWIPAPYITSRALQQVAFSTGARIRRVDLYHEPAFLPLQFSGPTVITAHDLAWIRYPQTHPSARVAHLNRRFPAALDRATHIITDAAYVRSEIMKLFGVAANRISAISLGVRPGIGPREAPDCERLLARHDLTVRGFILSVGTIEPRKNLGVLLHAYAGLPAATRKRLPLVIVGAKGWLTSPLEAQMAPLIRDRSVHLLGFLSDQDLAIFYASARMFVYPSLYEGFGLPPLEAMASATPVIVSNASTLPEVVGDAALQIDPHDERALRLAIERLDADELEAKRLRAAGLAQAAKFSWERCARETMGVYRRAMEGI